jgi:hypothetical protein
LSNSLKKVKIKLTASFRTGSNGQAIILEEVEAETDVEGYRYDKIFSITKMKKIYKQVLPQE